MLSNERNSFSRKPSLFSSLLKWAKHQKENFVTTAFLYTLEHLRACQEELARPIVERVLGCDLTLDQLEGIELAMHPSVDGGHPDLSADSESTPDKHPFYIEVKVDSKNLTFRQREGYGGANARRVFLTRHFLPQESLKCDNPHLVRWYQVADWFQQARDRLQQAPGSLSVDNGSFFLINQFLTFMEEEHVPLVRVKPDAIPGMADTLGDLMRQISHAAEKCRLKPKGPKLQKRNKGWFGYYLGEQSRLAKKEFLAHYALGVPPAPPISLVFNTFKCKANRQLAEDRRFTIDEPYERYRQFTNGFRAFWEPLDLERQGFFDLGLEGQMNCIEVYLERALKEARAIWDDQVTTPTR